jgi:hypothetical protein
VVSMAWTGSLDSWACRVGSRLHCTGM